MWLDFSLSIKSTVNGLIGHIEMLYSVSSENVPLTFRFNTAFIVLCKSLEEVFCFIVKVKKKRQKKL